MGLIVFSLCLMAGATFLGSRLAPKRAPEFPFAKQQIPDPDHQDKDTFTRKGPWGDLLTQNIQLERPVEYVAGDVRQVQPATWVFPGMNVPQAKGMFTANGLTADQAEKALTPDRLSTAGNDTVFKPSNLPGAFGNQRSRNGLPLDKSCKLAVEVGCVSGASSACAGNPKEILSSSPATVITSRVLLLVALTT